MKETELIKGCQKGEAKCQKALFMRYSGQLLTVSRRYARNHMEAEDWLQDAFIRIFKSIHQFKFEGSFEGWMRRIVVNTALKHFNKKSFQNEKSGLDDLYETSVDAQALIQLHQEELLKLIENLPDGYRVIFNLHAIEGYSHKEIGKMLQIGESTSRSQLTKARKTLQKKVLNMHKIVL